MTSWAVFSSYNTTWFCPGLSCLYLLFLGRCSAVTLRRFFFLKRSGGAWEIGVMSRASNKDWETFPRGWGSLWEVLLIKWCHVGHEKHGRWWMRENQFMRDYRRAKGTRDKGLSCTSVEAESKIEYIERIEGWNNTHNIPLFYFGTLCLPCVQRTMKCTECVSCRLGESTGGDGRGAGGSSRQEVQRTWQELFPVYRHIWSYSRLKLIKWGQRLSCLTHTVCKSISCSHFWHGRPLK